MLLRSFNINKGFSLIELLVVVAIIGVLAAVGIVSYIGYVAAAQETEAQNNMQGIYMVEEEFRSNSITNSYYLTNAGTNCAPALVNHADINLNLFGGNQQLNTVDPDFFFCIAEGVAADGGYLIITARPDGTDEMRLNANNLLVRL